MEILFENRSKDVLFPKRENFSCKEKCSSTQQKSAVVIAAQEPWTAMLRDEAGSSHSWRQLTVANVAADTRASGKNANMLSCD